jgi:hypothetical protein
VTTSAPKNCISSSVRNAPMRRDAKRALKSPKPQKTAAVSPRRISRGTLREKC